MGTVPPQTSPSAPNTQTLATPMVAPFVNLSITIKAYITVATDMIDIWYVAFYKVW